MGKEQIALQAGQRGMKGVSVMLVQVLLSSRPGGIGDLAQPISLAW